jgi:hypothetical protein
MLLSAADAEIKGQLWAENNQEYLAQQAAKEQQAEQDRLNGVTPRQPVKRKRAADRIAERASSMDEAISRVREFVKLPRALPISPPAGAGSC